MMSAQFNVGTVSRFALPGGSVTNNASDPKTRPSMDHNVAQATQESTSNPGLANRPVGVDPPMPRIICRFAPFDEHLNELTETSHWQKDLDDYFTNVFRRSVLSKYPIDGVVARALQVLGNPTQAKIRGLALIVYKHWVRMQFRSKDAHVSALDIVALVSRISDHLGWMSVHARNDFLNELNYVCIEKLKLTWRWYVAVSTRRVLPIPRKDLFMQLMAIIAVISHLFHGGQLQHGTALDGLGYITKTLPWRDAVAIIYALLHQLGPKFALERTGWYFIQRLLADLYPHTAGRARVDPLCQLVSAIYTLVAEWHARTRVTLCYAYPLGNAQFYAHRSQM